MKLNRQAARPRRKRSLPSYPRALGVGVVALVAACGGSVDVEEQGAGGATSTGQTTTYTTTTQTNTDGGSGGQAGHAEGGQGGHGWGGALSGVAPEPYGGGGAGGYWDSAS